MLLGDDVHISQQKADERWPQAIATLSFQRFTVKLLGFKYKVDKDKLEIVFFEDSDRAKEWLKTK